MGIFNICSHPYGHETQKDCVCPKLPCCLGNYTSHVLRSFHWQVPCCGQRDAANMTDGQHRERTDQDVCLGSTQKCLCAHKYRIDGSPPVSCKVCKCLKRGPWKMRPGWINSGRWKFLPPFHILERNAAVNFSGYILPITCLRFIAICIRTDTYTNIYIYKHMLTRTYMHMDTSCIHICS